MKNSELNKLLPEVVSIAIAAGQVIMAIYAKPDSIAVEYKDGGSPLTEADRSAHELIVRQLSLLGCQWPVLSEESAEIAFDERAGWSHYWLVDPLDGTREFINRNGQFTVNIALIDHGEPVLGVVYVPASGRVYFAARGVGAFARVDGAAAQPIRVADHMGDQPVRIVASRSHPDVRTAGFLEKMGSHQLANTGSSLKFCLVAENSADVYPRFGPTMEWDTAAAQCVVEAAGGIVCDFAGLPLAYNKKDLHNPPFLVMAPCYKSRAMDAVASLG